MGIPALNNEELHWGFCWVLRREAWKFMGVTKKDNLSVVICLPDKQRVAEWLAFSRPGDRFSMLTKARWELCDTGPIGDPHAFCLVWLPMLAASRMRVPFASATDFQRGNQKSSGKQVTFKRQNTEEKKQTSSTGQEGLETMAWSWRSMWAAGHPPPRATSMESLSLQASQEVPVFGT